jgi:transcriptional regulator NrdR family protein
MNCPNCREPKSLITAQSHQTRLYFKRLRICKNCKCRVKTKEYIVNYKTDLVAKAEEFEEEVVNET